MPRPTTQDTEIQILPQLRTLVNAQNYQPVAITGSDQSYFVGEIPDIYMWHLYPTSPGEVSLNNTLTDPMERQTTVLPAPQPNGHRSTTQHSPERTGGSQHLFSRRRIPLPHDTSGDWWRKTPPQHTDVDPATWERWEQGHRQFPPWQYRPQFLTTEHEESGNQSHPYRENDSWDSQTSIHTTHTGQTPQRQTEELNVGQRLALTHSNLVTFSPPRSCLLHYTTNNTYISPGRDDTSLA